ncbi:MAG: DUF4112 domain-containing protein [Alphaproteobacteria bacterium]|nr:DUF4112 domain-containing protein [Alphaproteobacteria bacterium]
MENTANTTYTYMPEHAERMQRVEKLAELLDNKWRVPGTGYHIGIDGMLGLLPGVGDTLSAALSSYIIYEAHKLKAPWYLKTRMIWNMFIDWLVGLVPLVGDLFDFGWKANQKNATLLRKHMHNKNTYS